MGLSGRRCDGALSGSIWGFQVVIRKARCEAKPRPAASNGADPPPRRSIDRANEIWVSRTPPLPACRGFVITKDRLDEIVPIVKTAMEERKMVEWDKDDLDAVGILKVDVLALGMLSCLRRAFTPL